ncbi:hypothetical protein COL922a_013275 [Colletotrichum nupharicola]|nr:hypothetical protein COL922a_013275 [Colletotrichum nupharicola]
MSSPTKNSNPPTSSTTASSNLSSSTNSASNNPSYSSNTTAPSNSLSTTNTNKENSGKSLPMPGLSGPANGPIGNLLKGPVDDNGKLKDAGLMVGIKLDLEAEVHLTARVRGDILVGLY